jgi:hypothetical protein
MLPEKNLTRRLKNHEDRLRRIEDQQTRDPLYLPNTVPPEDLWIAKTQTTPGESMSDPPIYTLPTENVFKIQFADAAFNPVVGLQTLENELRGTFTNAYSLVGWVEPNTFCVVMRKRATESFANVGEWFIIARYPLNVLVQFTLTESRSDPLVDEDLDATIGGVEKQVKFRAGFFPYSLTGAKGYASFKPDGTYEAVVCDQRSRRFSTILTGTMCPASAPTFSVVTPLEPFPFSQTAMISAALNTYKRAAQTGDKIEIAWNEALKDWEVCQVPHEAQTVVTAVRWNTSTKSLEKKSRSIAVETCEAETDWTNVVTGKVCP